MWREEQVAAKCVYAADEMYVRLIHRAVDRMAVMCAQMSCAPHIMEPSASHGILLRISNSGAVSTLLQKRKKKGGGGGGGGGAPPPDVFVAKKSGWV